MIEHTELRVGNWVADRNSNPQRVNSIINDKGAYVIKYKGGDDRTGDYSGSLNPIQLNDATLQKMGFYTDNNFWSFTCIDGGYIELIKCVGGYQLSTTQNPYGEGEVIKHIHHLQNLVYYLFGIELKFNLYGLN